MPERAEATTFLFADLERDLRLWARGPDAMRAALKQHDELARRAIAAHAGRLVKIGADGLQAAFAEPLPAVSCALELQRGLAALESAGGLPLRLRCGLHRGVCDQRGGEFYGAVVGRAARIMAAAHGGQALLSRALAEALAEQLPADTALRELGPVRLRDLSCETLYQLVAPGLRADFPPTPSLADVPNNLPDTLCAFIGRTREIREIRKLLRGSRVVTLVGMAGVGKSRLALHVAAESIDQHRDGAWLVELGPLQEGRRVPQALAWALGVREDPTQPIEQAIAAHLAGRELLVVLDKCEHVLEGAAAAARALLASGPGVRVLATSREPLRLPQEQPYLVPGLAVPRQARAREAIAHYYSVRLFVDRARGAAPVFQLTSDNAPAIAAICKRLDGIPLALELAASRVRDLPLRAISAQLHERLRLLEAGHRAELSRRLVLQAAVDWSHELLAPAERTLFRRVAVFAAGCTATAAADVCAGGALAAADVPGLLQSLAGRALLTIDRASGRYRMPETVRDYALLRLEEAGEDGEVRARHLECLAAFAAAARRELAGPRQGEWHARLDAERENVLAAHDWAGRRREGALAGLRLANAMKLYWMNRGLAPLGLRMTLEALQRPGLEAAAADRAQALFNAGQLQYFMGRHAEARGSLEASLVLARPLGEGYAAAVLQPLGMAMLAQGDLAAARERFEESLRFARAAGDKANVAGALGAIAMSHRMAGDPAAARPLYEEVVRIARATGNGEVEAVGLLNLAMVCLEGEAALPAREALEAAARIALEARFAPAAQSALEVCAALASESGDCARAARLLGTAEATALRSGLRRDAADALFVEPRARRARAALGESAYEAALREGARCEPFQALREAQAWLRSSPRAGTEPLTASR